MTLLSIPSSFLSSTSIIAFVTLSSLSLLFLSYSGFTPRAQHTLLRLSSTPSHLAPQHPAYHRERTTTSTFLNPLYLSSRQRCDFSIFYNKPPKTAGTYTQNELKKWARLTEPNQRTIEDCGGKRDIETNVRIRDCLPDYDNNCLLFTAHIKLDRSIRRLIFDRLPSVKYITTTRYPPHRITSLFLQLYKYNFTDVQQDKAQIEDDFEKFLVKFNPWTLYNYHSGENMKGACPVGNNEMQKIFNVASLYDIVLDVNLVKESNTILRHYGLFQLPEVSEDMERKMVRGTHQFALNDRLKSLLRSKMCVEDQLHRALHFRMAATYERILRDDESCINHGNIHVLNSCMDERERAILGNHSWVI